MRKRLPIRVQEDQKHIIHLMDYLTGDVRSEENGKSHLRERDNSSLEGDDTGMNPSASDIIEWMQRLKRNPRKCCEGDK